MALNETLGIKVVFGGAIGGSFTSAFSKATGDIGKLSKEIDDLTKAKGARKDNEQLIEAAKASKEKAEAAKQAARDELTTARERQRAADRAADVAARIAKRKKSTNAEKADAIRLREEAGKMAVETERAAKAETHAKDQAVLRAKAYEKITRDQDRQNKRLGFSDDASILGRIRILNAKKNYAEAREQLNHSKESFISLWKSTAVWVSALSGVLSAGTFRIARSVSEVADNAGGLADRLGMTTRALQEMQYAGLQNNLTIEDTNDFLGKLQIRLHGAYTAGGDAADALRLLRLDAASLAYMSPDEAVMEISRALQSVPNASDRAALAVKILGKEGAKMANMLASGPEELAKLRAEARETGFVLGEEGVRNGRAFDATLKRLGATFDGVRNIIGGGMMPALTELMGALSGALLDNMQFFKNTAALLGDVVRASAPTIVFLAKSLLMIGKAVALVVEPIFRVVDGLGLWPVAFGFIIGGGAIMAVSRLWGIARAIRAVVIANRELAVSEGVGGLSKLLSGLNIGGGLSRLPAVGRLVAVGFSGGFKSGMAGLGRILLSPFRALLPAIMPVITAVGTFLAGVTAPVWGIVAAIVAVIGAAIWGIRDNWKAITAAFAPGMAILRDGFNAVKNWFSDFADRYPNIIKTFGLMMKGVFYIGFGPLLLLGKAIGKLFEGIGYVFSGLMSFLRPVMDWIGSAFNTVMGFIDKALWITSIIGKTAGYLFGSDDSAPGKTPEAGSPSISGSMNLPMPASASQVAARSAASGAQSGSPVAITVNAAPGQSPEAIARMTVSLLDQRNRRTNSGSFSTP